MPLFVVHGEVKPLLASVSTAGAAVIPLPSSIESIFWGLIRAQNKVGVTFLEIQQSHNGKPDWLSFWAGLYMGV